MGATEPIMALASQRPLTLVSAQGTVMETLGIAAALLPVTLSTCGLNRFHRF